METKVTKTFKKPNGKDISNIEFIANTGVLTDKSVEQHVHVETKRSGSGRNASVSTETSFSYSTRVTMDDENGQSHEVTLPGKNFSCPHNGLVSFINVKNAERGGEYYYSVFTHHNQNIYGRDHKHLPSSLKSIPSTNYLFLLLSILIGIIGTGWFVLAALNGRTSEFTGFISMAAVCAVIGAALYFPYYKIKSNFLSFLDEGNDEVTAMIYEKTQGFKDKATNPNLDGLKNLDSNEGFGQKSSVW